MSGTTGYTAVFPEEVIAAHQHFIERRRATHPTGELRSATGEEWAEFENHFLLRKVALGECHRPTALRVSTNTPAPAADSCASTPPNYPGSRR
jgi:hypothetical protein